MKRIKIVVLLLLTVGFSSGCNKKTTTEVDQKGQGTAATVVGQTAGSTQAEREEEARKAQLVEARRKAEQEETALLAIEKHISSRYGSHIKPIHGRRFSTNQRAAEDWLQELLDKVPKRDFVDLVSMYTAIGGFDGSTTREALAKCQRSFVGKYYMLQGDVFQIQADRDYPRDGENEFMLFGLVNLPPSMPVNVAAISDEKIPPYSLSPMLTKIVGFNLGTNRGGKSIIIPEVEVVAAVSSSSFMDNPSDVVISQPSVVAQLLHLHLPLPGSESDGSQHLVEAAHSDHPGATAQGQDQRQRQRTLSERDVPIPITQQQAESLLVSKVAPQYPNLARQARVQGMVTLDAIIGKDGSVHSLSVASGHPMLVPAAIAAVKQWRYKPYDSDGEPSDVKTQVTVNFVLNSQSQ